MPVVHMLVNKLRNANQSLLAESEALFIENIKLSKCTDSLVNEVYGTPTVDVYEIHINTLLQKLCTPRHAVWIGTANLGKKEVVSFKLFISSNIKNGVLCFILPK